MQDSTSVPMLIIGGGPFALSAAALAGDRGVDAVVVGRPMGFWSEHMPPGMLLRSGIDWHLDATGVYTLEAYLRERALSPKEVDPIPVELFREYADWFRRAKGITLRQDLVTRLTHRDGTFYAELDSGGRIRADVVVAAAGISYFTRLPDWGGSIPSGRASHSCDLVRFDALSGQRVLIVGGRQSAYEWAALIGEHGAARVDVVHRHPMPRFASVSWTFFDDYLEATMRGSGWWRRLPVPVREAILARCWEAGRGTLEPWLPARLDAADVRIWPETAVVLAEPTVDGGPVRITMSNTESLTVDQVIFATGYAVELARVPFLADLVERIKMRNGSPVLDEALQSTVPGLYLTGFSAAQDFGPFFGFVKAAPASAALIMRDMLARTG
ncbi:NAD(P)-binding domain-containing protein [Streptomyces sp. PA03-1a]|nr:NAD(P)-binding domain-containing protein [Streptomyces sp. PA03-1a]MDX2818404.1 NAD(P)-binding domain-containing protein [Streptomyces sp. PA03-5A]